MYYDLNIITPNTEFDRKRRLIESAIADGYDGIAYNTEVTGTMSIKDMNKTEKVDLGTLKLDTIVNSMPNKTSKQMKTFQQFSRVTVVCNEMRAVMQLVDSNQILKSYDVVAAKTKDAKVFHALCLENDVVDIITFDLTEKLPYKLKRGQVTEAIKKGIMFELSYSQAIEDMSIRRMVFSNAITIMNATKFKNIIITSKCADNFHHRSPFDVMNIFRVLGMPKDAATKAVGENTVKIIERGKFRKSFKGIVAFATAEDEKEFQEKHNARLKKDMEEEESKQEEPAASNKNTKLGFEIDTSKEKMSIE